jgi:hypothetical protein
VEEIELGGVICTLVIFFKFTSCLPFAGLAGADPKPSAPCGGDFFLVAVM